MNNVTKLVQLSDQDLVTKTLRDHITGKIDLTPVQVQSINILAKASEMFTTKIEQVKPQRTTEELTAAVKEKLQILLENKDGIYLDENGKLYPDAEPWQPECKKKVSK